MTLNKEILDKLLEYVEAKFDEEYESRQEGADGYRQSALVEREKVEKIKQELYDLL